MGRKPRSPSFFKVLIGDFTEKLRIPPTFVKNFNGDMPKTPILKSVKGKSLVTMEQNNEGCFFKRKWSKFVKDHRLEAGDFLVFRFVGKSEFEVVIYTKTGCEKDLGLAANKNINDQFTTTKQKKEIPSKTRNISGDDIKRKRCHDRDHDHEMKMKREQERIAEAIDSVKPEHPYCVLVFKKYKKFNIVLPKGFANETGLTRKRSTVIKDPAGSVWPINITLLKAAGQAHLSSGWSDFCAANGLADGDLCLLQFIQGAGNVLHVQIFKKEG